jgi:general secretion pathway protein L
MPPRNTGPIPRYYAWWLGELSALITKEPSKTRQWRTLLLRHRDGIDVIDSSKAKLTTLVASEGFGERDTQVEPGKNRFAAENLGHIVLRLSAEDVLERIVQVPRAASDVIEPVLRNQMTRIVPWPENATCYGFAVLGANRNAPEQLDIKVAATTKTVLERALADVRAHGFNPATIDYASPAEASVGIELMSLEPDPRQAIARRLHIAVVTLVGLCLIAGSLGFYQLWRGERESSELAEKISAARRLIADSARSNAESAKLWQASEKLIDRKAGEPAVGLLIAALSRALPDNAYLTELEIRGQDARIAGKSNESTVLIADIESTPEFDSVRFAAPTTRDDRGLENFTITARAVPRNAAKGDRDARN